MRKISVLLIMLILAVSLFALDSLHVSGRVVLDNAGLANVKIGPAFTDKEGYYSFKLPAGSDTTLAPHLNAFIFSPASCEISTSDTRCDSLYFTASRQIKKVIIIAGQSNTGFNGSSEYFISDEVDENIPYYMAYAGVEHGLDVLGPVSNFGVYNWRNFGFEMLLARTLFKEYTDSLAVMKIGWGGTSLVTQWCENGDVWEWFVNMHEHAVDSLHANGYEPEYIGFFWYQGESDRNLERSSVYGDSLYQFVDRVRNLLPNGSELDSLPFVCVRILWNPASIYEEPVRQAQMDIINNKPYTAWVDIDDCDPYRVSHDNLHFNGIALNRIGYKLATAYLDLVGHPVDSSMNVTIEFTGDMDSPTILQVKGDTTFQDDISSSSYQFPSKLGDSLSLTLELPTDDYVSDPVLMIIPFVYDPDAILEGTYMFNINIKTKTIKYKNDMDHTLINTFPNPFNSYATISCDILSPGVVKLSIYDLSGKKISTLIDRKMAPGSYDIQWNADGFPSGIYVAKLLTPVGTQQTKLLLLK